MPINSPHKDLQLDRCHKKDWIEVIKSLPDNSLDMVMTSPPYWSKRDYGFAGQLGLEESPEEFLRKIVTGFLLLRPKLKDTGTMFINFGDGWWGNKGANGQDKAESIMSRPFQGKVINRPHQIINQRIRPSDRTHLYIKPKDLVGMPWLLALALRNGKWNLTECIEVYRVIRRIQKAYEGELIPYKVQREINNIMDEYAYETKKGYFLRNDIIWHKKNPHPESPPDRFTNAHEYIFFFTKSRKKYFFDLEAVMEEGSENTHAKVSKKTLAEIAKGIMPDMTSQNKVAMPGSMIRNNSSFASATAGMVDKRRKRDVFVTGTNSHGTTHIAGYNDELIAPCILAGCPEGGVVFDPFFGSGRTGITCKKLNRHYIGAELSEDSIKEQARLFHLEFGLFPNP